ncbi:MAG: siderophore-interacting protein, partial [Pseudomonadota bacterium]
MPEVAAAMRWSDTDGVGGLPPNFSFVRARDVAPLGPNFLRVTLEGEDLSAHQNDSIHFRLVQPPEGGEAEWPWVAPNGSIKWPDGDSAPHKPVYTARAVDYAANTMLVDIYIHDGGRTTEWAQGLLSGMRDRQVVGLLGPSGGGILEADRVLMATDETGFPAAARILENLPDGTTGDLYLEAENGADCDYSFEVPPGLSVTWFARAKGDTLARVTTEALAAHAGSKVWFAGERSQARDVREAAKSAGWEPKELRVSGFWTAPAG